MDRDSIAVAKSFAGRVKSSEVKPDKMLLFGSRARGDAFVQSDYDFLVVSDFFDKKPFWERMDVLYDYWEEPQDLEAACYTRAEFARKVREPGIVSQAVMEGVEV